MSVSVPQSAYTWIARMVHKENPFNLKNEDFNALS